MIAQGMKQGMAQGIEQGIEQGMAQGIVETGVEFGLSEQDILDKLQKKLDISLSKAEEYLERFRKL